MYQFILIISLSLSASYAVTKYRSNSGIEYFFSRSEMDFNSAKNFCADHLGQLAIINSSGEQDWVLRNLKAKQWIGLYSSTGNTGYKWLDDSSISYSKWYRGHPLCTESCCAAFFDTDDTWMSVECSTRARALCQTDRIVDSLRNISRSFAKLTLRTAGLNGSLATFIDRNFYFSTRMKTLPEIVDTNSILLSMFDEISNDLIAKVTQFDADTNSYISKAEEKLDFWRSGPTASNRTASTLDMYLDELTSSELMASHEQVYAEVEKKIQNTSAEQTRIVVQLEIMNLKVDSLNTSFTNYSNNSEVIQESIVVETFDIDSNNLINAIDVLNGQLFNTTLSYQDSIIQVVTNAAELRTNDTKGFSYQSIERLKSIYDFLNMSISAKHHEQLYFTTSFTFRYALELQELIVRQLKVINHQVNTFKSGVLAQVLKTRLLRKLLETQQDDADSNTEIAIIALDEIIVNINRTVQAYAHEFDEFVEEAVNQIRLNGSLNTVNATLDQLELFYEKLNSSELLSDRKHQLDVLFLELDSELFMSRLLSSKIPSVMSRNMAQIIKRKTKYLAERVRFTNGSWTDVQQISNLSSRIIEQVINNASSRILPHLVELVRITNGITSKLQHLSSARLNEMTEETMNGINKFVHELEKANSNNAKNSAVQLAHMETMVDYMREYVNKSIIRKDSNITSNVIAFLTLFFVVLAFLGFVAKVINNRYFRQPISANIDHMQMSTRHDAEKLLDE